MWGQRRDRNRSEKAENVYPMKTSGQVLLLDRLLLSLLNDKILALEAFVYVLDIVCDIFVSKIIHCICDFCVLTCASLEMGGGIITAGDKDMIFGSIINRLVQIYNLNESTIKVRI